MALQRLLDEATTRRRMLALSSLLRLETPPLLTGTQPAMTDPRRTRRWRKLRAWVIDRDHGICWRCGGTGANEGGHVIPYALRPDLVFDPDNVRAEHSTRKYAASLGYNCPGNRNTNRSTPTQPNRRNW